MSEAAKAPEVQTNPDTRKSNGVGGTELLEAVLDGNPPAEGGPSWENASSGEKRDRVIYVIGRALLATGKAIVLVIAALFSTVFGLASKQNPRKK